MVQTLLLHNIFISWTNLVNKPIIISLLRKEFLSLQFLKLFTYQSNQIRHFETLSNLDVRIFSEDMSFKSIQ